MILENFKMWIGGKWVDAASGETMDVINPATEEVIARIPRGGQADVDQAVAAAKKAFPEWSRKTQVERINVAYQIAAALRKNAAELGRLDIIDHGTPAAMAAFWGMAAAGHFEYAAQVSRGVMGDVVPHSPGKLAYLQREPVGVCALIVPWNLPLMMVAWKLASALVVGNTCVVKPASIDSLAALKLGEVLEEVDLPAGAVNIISGPGSTAGEALCDHKDVDLVSFTGSCETGKRIMAIGGGTVKRMCMELGGKNPFIVLADADVDAAAGKAVMNQFMNSGMLCASPGRIYVHESRYQEFTEKFVEAAKRQVVGDPSDKRTNMGPMVSAEHRDSVESYIKSGQKDGARLVLGGKRPTAAPLDKGYFVMPTVFADVTQDMKIAREEIFGPVACIMKFSSESKVVEAANDNTFGLAAGVWTKDVPKGIRMANAIRAGSVWVNDYGVLPPEWPWGGFRESGFGKENSVIGLDSYTQIKAISVDLNVQAPHHP
jgi:acyl-CoA reductase-like NAD-dependent aldehyde dehydrogenase